MNKKQAQSADKAARDLHMKLFGSEIQGVWGGGTKVETYLVPKVMCTNRAKKEIIAKFGYAHQGHKIHFEISEQHPLLLSRRISVELL